jgi:hypothetical protein
MAATNITSNFKLNLTDFDKIPWGEEQHNNWHIVDALMARFIAISLIQGAWENALAVTVGNRYIDTDADTIYEVLVAHTTPSTGTFSAARIANSSHWQSVTVDVANKGTYAQATTYNANDFIVDGVRFGIVSAQYTSDSVQATTALSYDADVTNGDIITLINLIFADGSASAPGLAFEDDPNTGMYRIGADNIGWSVNGVKGLDLSTSGLAVTGTLAATAITGSGVLSIDDTTETTSGTSGSIHTDGGLGVAKKLHVIGTATHGGDILSDTDSTDSLGSTGVRWLKLWVDSITSGGDIAGATGTFSGEVTGAGFTGTLDGVLGGGAAAAATVTTLTTSGIASIDDTTDTSSGTTGSIHTDGGLGIAKSLHVATTAKLVGVTTHGGDIVSDTDSTDSLGTTGVRWLKLWVDSIQTTANLDVAGDLVVTGDLTINGTTVTNDATNTEIKDPLIELNSGAGSNANDLGLIMERGSTGDNVFMGWDESGDHFAFGTTTATGDSTGNITYSFGELRASGAVFSGTSSDLGAVTTIDINGGTVDGAVIGGASAAAITGTTLTANTSITLATGSAMTGVLDSDTMTGATAALLSSSESIKAYVDSSSKAAGISMTWETTTTDTDQGVGKVWANNATLSSATVLYFDDVERNSVSINALIDTLDDPTATNSATIYIQEAGTATAGVVFKCSGAVTSASTYSKVAVTHVATFGTLSDGDVVGVTIAFSGNNGTGTGDLLASNNLSDVSNASTSLNNLGGVGLGLVLALG